LKISVLHDSAEPPGDPAPPQVSEALCRLGHDAALLPVGDSVEGIVSSLREAAPEIVFNMTESFDGKSALDAGLAGLLSLLVVGFAGGRIATLPSNLPLIKGFSVIGVRAGEYGRRDPLRGAQNRQAVDALAAAGVFTPLIGARFALDDGLAAYRALAAGAVPGKIVLQM
jgi:NADPH:quinone reductase-like Zn-dependent oxidoreductase